MQAFWIGGTQERKKGIEQQIWYYITGVKNRYHGRIAMASWCKGYGKSGQHPQSGPSNCSLSLSSWLSCWESANSVDTFWRSPTRICRLPSSFWQAWHHSISFAPSPSVQLVMTGHTREFTSALTSLTKHNISLGLKPSESIKIIQNHDASGEENSS